MWKRTANEISMFFILFYRSIDELIQCGFFKKIFIFLLLTTKVNESSEREKRIE